MTPYYQDENIRLFNCDVMDGLKAIDAESIQCCVTSPPYWGLRDYGVEGQLGLEKTPEEYIEKMVQVFRGVHRVLKKDGTLWINIGDSYYGSWGNCGAREGKQRVKNFESFERKGQAKRRPSASLPHQHLKPKDLVGIPWMLAFALRSDGWYLRQDIIWSKPNPMPESVTDRCTKSHEYIFLLSKSQKYYYDAEAIRTTPKDFDDDTRRMDAQRTPAGWDNSKGNGGHGRFHKAGRADKQRGHKRPHNGFNDRWDGMTTEEQQANGANKRSVWNIATKGYPEAHFATFPPALIKPCILAGSREGDTVLDTFFGSGVTGEVARDHGRKCDGIEIHPDYCELSLKRFKQGILNF